MKLVPRRVTSSTRVLPDFLVIGAMKCGTTSFYQYLIRHPQTVPAREKEVHFFDYRWHLGLNWYRASFPRRRDLPVGCVTGESTPYYFFHPGVPARVAEALPAARLLLLLRDPVERAFSHYRRQRALGLDPLSFEDALEAEEERLAGEGEKLRTRRRYESARHQAYSYKARGRYAEQLDRWLEWFDRDAILVIRSEDLFRDPGSAAGSALRFLGLPERDLGLLPRINAAPELEMRPETRDRLRAYFEPHNERLRRMLAWESTW